jgi:hypothetical protein
MDDVTGASPVGHFKKKARDALLRAFDQQQDMVLQLAATTGKTLEEDDE